MAKRATESVLYRYRAEDDQGEFYTVLDIHR